ncbi:signal peptidase II [Psychromarinibacter sp. C21-152]|uniref:Lipoprotein signal peptidase n=1 Tax=Psychromarinibacter sediminicola TaxID=3033385 RepID=A0AAE3NWA6_9RHOB|nr:signal peptidase II [Psychromarinibacter sediminicola]MDF0601817.1 signal peptidase II [Psychromarinibacter sediminicola]
MKRMYLVAGAVFVLDQLSKLYVLSVLNVDRHDVDVFPPFLTFRMAWNYGINFGLFSGHAGWTRWLLIGIALAISAWVAWWMRREPRPLARVSGGLLIGGALGNVVDRLLYGAVADFLNMSCCGIDNPYSFNIADIAIFVGAAGLILFTGERKKTP